MFQTNNGSYDALCGMDYFWYLYVIKESTVKSLLMNENRNFYDQMVMREVPSSLNEMQMFPEDSYPYFRQLENREKLHRKDKPPNHLMNVFSCWNGIVIMNAEPFVKHRIQFRALRTENGYTASECCLIFADFHRHGYHRIFVDPLVSFYYEIELFDFESTAAPHYELPPLEHSFFDHVYSIYWKVIHYIYWGYVRLRASIKGLQPPNMRNLDDFEITGNRKIDSQVLSMRTWTDEERRYLAAKRSWTYAKLDNIDELDRVCNYPVAITINE